MRKIIRFILLLIFLTSSSMLVWLLLIEPYIQDKSYDKIRTIYLESDVKEDSKLANLQKINPDIIGWIRIPDTNIDYPVLKASKTDPEFYLTHNYEKNNSRYGSIFLDANCNMRVSKNLILHGHHMRDGSMFANLVKYGDLSFYKSHPIVKFSDESGERDWKIISIFKSNTDPKKGDVFNYLRITFVNESSFLEYLHEIKVRSLINIPVDTVSDDTLLTLSTCSYEFDGCRTVVVARRVRENEDSFVDVGTAEKNTNPVMPEYMSSR